MLQNAGPLGAPGMPEWGMLPIPKKLLHRACATWCAFRCADERHELTARACCTSRRSRVGGPLALVRDGDLIELDVAARRLSLKVEDRELEARRAHWTPPEPQYPRGFGLLYSKHVSQADKGCDFDFLEGTAAITDPEIH